MLKKGLVVGGAFVLLAGLFMGRDAVSYLSTSMGRMHAQVKRNVPVEFEIDRARQMIKNLGPEIRENMHRIAREEVEVGKLEREVMGREELLAKQRDYILREKADLESGSRSFVYAGETFTALEVREDLAKRFKSFKTEEATVESLRQVLKARNAKLNAAREKLDSMLSQKRQLEVEVEQLEARLKMIEVAQTTSDFNFDDSQLARTKELLDEISTRLEIDEKMVNAAPELQERIPVEKEVEGDTDEDILDAVTNYFEADLDVIVKSN